MPRIGTNPYVGLRPTMPQHDAGMREAADDARLVEEALAALRIGALDQLDRDAPADVRVFGEVDLAHCAPAKQAQDLVLADALGCHPP